MTNTERQRNRCRRTKPGRELQRNRQTDTARIGKRETRTYTEMKRETNRQGLKKKEVERRAARD